MEKLTIILSAIGGIIGAIAIFVPVIRRLLKEIKDVAKVYNEAKADGNVTNKELAEIGKEAIDALIELLNLWKLIKKTFLKKNK